MNSIEFSNRVGVTVRDFDLQQTLECGQCFRFYKMDDNTYLVLANNQFVKIIQEKDQLVFFCSNEAYNTFWKQYFDLERDYGTIKAILSEKDNYLKTAVTEKYGVRLLQQEPWEMLISFILSQTKQIPHIKKLIEELSKTFGSLIGNYEGIPYYAFPKPQQLKGVTEETLRKLKVGFRAAYIVDAVEKVQSGQIDLEALKNMSNDEAREQLISIKGVGRKIADCVLLFAYNRYEVFPTDVWVKRVVQYYYPVESQNMDKIHDFARNYFGQYAGFAQQYLFYHARDNKIGK